MQDDTPDVPRAGKKLAKLSWLLPLLGMSLLLITLPFPISHPYSKTLYTIAAGGLMFGGPAGIIIGLFVLIRGRKKSAKFAGRRHAIAGCSLGVLSCFFIGWSVFYTLNNFMPNDRWETHSLEMASCVAEMKGNLHKPTGGRIDMGDGRSMSVISYRSVSSDGRVVMMLDSYLAPMELIMAPPSQVQDPLLQLSLERLGATEQSRVVAGEDGRDIRVYATLDEDSQPIQFYVKRFLTFVYVMSYRAEPDSFNESDAERFFESVAFKKLE